jgi:hypothetical protein
MPSSEILFGKFGKPLCEKTILEDMNDLPEDNEDELEEN